ncbi:hypothetical protein FBY41_2013 [Humibacillus xanthopallidus]|uniref:Uncharacterized protein n=1 Tax=Humibacillus xanthopallidus TaxID=412689 RepID=A0A543HUG8_9MICO|nr:hypothetical protein FBY41_2013 [Humibacillus xanthopallidus]
MLAATVDRVVDVGDPVDPDATEPARAGTVLPLGPVAGVEHAARARQAAPAATSRVTLLIR